MSVPSRRRPTIWRDWTIGVVDEGFSEEVGAQQPVIEAVEGAVGRFETLGASVRRVSLPEHMEGGGIAFAGFIEGMTALMASGGNGRGWAGRYWPELSSALGPGLREHAQELSAELKITLVLGSYLRREYSGALYAKAQNLRSWQRGAYDRALADAALSSARSDVERARGGRCGPRGGPPPDRASPRPPAPPSLPSARRRAPDRV